ncbi:MAG: cyclodeaminase/cyclohydrolase family protein [Desulfotomaculaceae bacterium]|nr:cyclodeaminase/cyclohydrolase family protein [Desulfotomaculaceae bacterium]
MSDIYNKTLREVIELSASSKPVPGGGSVSAIVANFGLAMIAMVCRLTAGKIKEEEVGHQVNEILDTANNLIQQLEKLVDEDMSAFENYIAATRLPKNTDDEIKARGEAIQNALKSATETPLEIARVCLEALRIAAKLSTIGNKQVISDVGVGAVATEAAISGVLLSADINTAMIKDKDYVQKIVARKEMIQFEARQLKAIVMTVVQERINSLYRE